MNTKIYETKDFILIPNALTDNSMQVIPFYLSKIVVIQTPFGKIALTEESIDKLKTLFELQKNSIH